VRGLRREPYGSHPGERAGQLRGDGQAGVKRDPLDSANAEREQGPLILSTTKGALHRRAVGVQPSPPLRLARDQRVEPVGLHPSAGGLALAGRAAPLGRAALRVRPGEPPSCQEPKIGAGTYRRVDAVDAEAAALAVAIAECRPELTAGAPGAGAGPGSGAPTRRCAREVALSPELWVSTPSAAASVALR
jgi:hypothetical protein